MALVDVRLVGLDGLTVGERLASLRAELKWTQSELAERAGTFQAQIGKMERGEFATGWRRTYEAVAKALQCPWPYFMYGVDTTSTDVLHVGMQAAMNARLNNDDVRACRLYAEVINDRAMEFLPELYHHASAAFGQALIGLAERGHDSAVAAMYELATEYEPGSRAWAMTQAQLTAEHQRAGDLDRAAQAGFAALDQVDDRPVWNAEVAAIAVELAPGLAHAGRHREAGDLLDRIARRMDSAGSPEWQYQFHCAAVEAAVQAEDAQRATHHATTAWTRITPWAETEDVPPDLVATMVNGLTDRMLAWERRPLATMAKRYLSARDVPWENCAPTTQARRTVNAACADRILGKPQAAVERLLTVLDDRDGLPPGAPMRPLYGLPADLAGRAKVEMGRALGDLGERQAGASYLRRGADDLTAAGLHAESEAASAHAVHLTLPPTPPAGPTAAATDKPTRRATQPPGHRPGPDTERL